ncbi:putative lipoprotein [Beutenbergia cavernae DSM 12333]|uniref:Putative lipoprotein n=1 Tax=Beutenbergia cavernae (strain ATCC BAA-8 / DSM 12333 / CCUG 43141 / JCM 11478 / NBRC 16432 / NCIMB 13614 / HKI 0122) TaxID=471853 RepID=C5C456_BEUC1|nr:lipoprotein [Beutenbergia cavernae]ACQ79969.1 putative lipoprotein [Beutenbergia cavernae DSM 12333]
MRKATRFAAVGIAAVLALTGCTGAGELEPDPTAEATTAAMTTAPEEATTLVAGDDPAALAITASQMFFTSASIAVLADAGDPAAQLRAASVATLLGLPVLLTGASESADADVAAELARLDATTALTVGTDVVVPEEPGRQRTRVIPAPSDPDDLATVVGREITDAQDVTADGEIEALAGLEVPGSTILTLVPEPGDEPTDDASGTPGSTDVDPDAGGLPIFLDTQVQEGVLAVSDGDTGQVAALGTARAAGADVLVVPSGDTRTDPAAIQAIAARADDLVVGFGSALGAPEVFTSRIAAARTGVELPAGGQLALPGARYVALYGSPVTPTLGVLGEQGVAETIARAQQHAAPYAALTDEPVVPALEIIVTVASSSPGDDGNYSNEWPSETFRPLVDAAHEAGMYVVLDLQPGRTSFLDQAKLYADLLALPYVGLALDPEWRLGPDQVHLEQIGSVDIAEVNEVVTWLADLTAENHLPQKILILHQFSLSMITNRGGLDTSREELAVVIHADGQGSQAAKAETWAALHADAPEGVFWGWKNFYDEDAPMLTPEQTFAVTPLPDFVSYQ